MNDLEGFDSEREALARLVGRSIFFRRPKFEILAIRYLDITEDGLVDVHDAFLKRNEPWFSVAEDGTFTLLHDPYEFIQQRMAMRIEHSARVLEHFVEEIDTLEDKLFSNRFPRHGRDALFRYKQDLSRMQRVFSRGAIVLQEFRKCYGQAMGSENDLEIQGLVDFQLLHERQTTVQLLRLDTLYHYFSSQRSDRLNSNIYALALVSGVFLPMHFLVGFFGMNTQNLYFSKEPLGTVYVTMILVAVFAALILGLPILKILHQTLLVSRLGRFSFYQTIVKRVAEMTDDIRLD